MQTKWAKNFAAAIKSGILTEGQIRAARRILANAINRDGCVSCTKSDAWELIELINLHKPRVTDEQARKGADWLYSVSYTPRGKVRNTDLASQFNDRDRTVIRELQEQPRFHLVELEDVGGTWSKFAPIYRAVGKSASFDYAAQAWQTGKPFVVRHA